MSGLLTRALGRQLGWAASGGSSVLWLRAVTTSVVVPPMGDSIAEGTVAIVLKRQGDTVQENETIAQLETDKVTIDIKAPTAGVLQKLFLKESDVVTPGQMVGEVSGGTLPSAVHAGGNHSLSRADSLAPSASQQQQQQMQVSGGSDGGSSHSSLPPRQPRISFPPRVTEAGVRISSLPASDAAAYLAQWSVLARAGAPSSSSSSTLVSGSPQANAAQAGGAVAALTPSSQQPPSWTNMKGKQVVMLKEMPSRRSLTDREMELVELGGAE